MDAQEPPSVPDSSYRTCWHKFCAFVGSSPSGAINLYLSRESIDLFFEQVIPMLDVNPDSVGDYKSALQWYADKNRIHGRETRRR